jgi:phospholipase/carboxylesterase
MTGLVHQVRPARGAPQGAVVLLHGRGTDEHDLLPLADALDPERRLHVVTPRGPLSLPPGGAHWYALGGIPTPDPETFRATFAALAAWLDALPAATGVPWERTVLGGFSQGAVMSYALALGAGRPSPTAVLAFSGFLPEVPGFELALSDRAGLPVAIGHGSFDPVIPVDFGRQAAERLTGAGLDVTYRESPVVHTIDPRFLADLPGRLQAAIAARAQAG